MHVCLFSFHSPSREVLNLVLASYQLHWPANPPIEHFQGERSFIIVPIVTVREGNVLTHRLPFAAPAAGPGAEQLLLLLRQSRFGETALPRRSRPDPRSLRYLLDALKGNVAMYPGPSELMLYPRPSELMLELAGLIDVVAVDEVLYVDVGRT